MARQPTGQVLERQGKRGRVYALRFRAYGRRQYVTLGTAEEGWTRTSAAVELENVLADVRRNIWRPAEREPVAEEPRPEPTFHEFASEWFEANKGEWRENTRLDYHWQLTHHLLPFFARRRLSAITVEEVDRYRHEKVREAKLSATSINKTITRLGQVLEVAVEYGHVPRNVAHGKRRRVKATTPHRSYLERAGQVEALLAAAGELDASARCDYRGLGRRALLATLVFAGPRIGEALALRWRDVDLAGGRLRVGEAKTAAGVREIELLPSLRDELAEHKADAREVRPGGLVFATSEGSPQTATNVRRRVLARAIKKADERLAREGATPLPERLTPHSLRRTYASLLFALGRTAPEVMEQLGHADPKLTLRVYARAMRREKGENERLRTLAGVVEVPALSEEAPRQVRVPPAAISLDHRVASC
jgi:integrase